MEKAEWGNEKIENMKDFIYQPKTKTQLKNWYNSKVLVNYLFKLFE